LREQVQRRLRRAGLEEAVLPQHWLALLAVSALVPAMLEAQAGTTPASSRARVVLRRPAPSSAAGAGGNVCLELESSPTPLVHAPEGLALLRLKKQLESAALTLEQRQQLERNQLQRIVQVQRGVDSLMQVVVRSARDEGERAGEARPVTSGAMTGGRRMLVTIDSGYGPVTVNLEAMMRGVVPGADSAVSLMVPQVERTLRALQPDIDRFIRLLQPQVAAFAGEAEASLPGGAVAPSGYMGLSLSGAQIRIVTPEGVMTSHCDYPLVETVDVGSPAARAGIAAGDTLVLFPEGTSSDGRRVLPFKTSFFAAAGLPGVKVQPVSLAYRGHRNMPMNRRLLPSYAWYGEMELIPHLLGALSRGPIEVTVVLHAPLALDDGRDRKQLARHAEAEVRRGLSLALHDPARIR
jgi:hypothetical protein